MAKINKHGLSRTVPPDVKREVRKRCGFGCVICGLSFYDYEHFDPDFVDATEHNPEGMTLLCSQCNQKRARDRLSAQSVAAANANPKCLQRGFSSESFDFGSDPIEVQFAGVSFYACRYLIMVNDKPLLAVSPPKEPGQPVLLSGLFADGNGNVTLTIDDNVFSVNSDNWDVECVGPRITIRSAHRDISLILKMEPPSRMVVERIDMKFQGVFLRGNMDLLETSFDGKRWAKYSAIGLHYGYVGMSFDNRPSLPNPANDAKYALES